MRITLKYWIPVKRLAGGKKGPRAQGLIDAVGTSLIRPFSQNLTYEAESSFDHTCTNIGLQCSSFQHDCLEKLLHYVFFPQIS